MSKVDKAYGKWLADCLKQFNRKRKEERKYTSVPSPLPIDYSPDQVVEFDDDGTAYPHSVSGIDQIPRVATSWVDSKYYSPGF